MAYTTQSPLTPRHRRLRIQIFAVTWLAYFGFYLTRKSFSVAKIGISLDPSMGHMNMEAMGWIDLCFLAAYALGQFVFGIAGDRFGSRRVVTTGMLCSIVASVAMGVSSLTVVMCLLFTVQGLAQSTGWGPLIKNVGNFFAEHERGVVLGFWCTSYAVGGMAASIYAGYWGDKLGWRYAFHIPAVTVLLIWIVFILFQRNRPEDFGLLSTEKGDRDSLSGPPHEHDEGSVSLVSIVSIVTDRNVMLLAAIYFFIKPLRYALIFWGPQYIHSKLGVGMAQSGFLSSLFDMAGIFGTLFAGFLSDRVFAAKRIPICSLSLLTLGILLFFIHMIPATRLMLGLSFMVIGFIIYAPDSIVSATATIDFGTKGRTSTAAGFVNFIGSIGAFVGGVVPGFFAARWGWHGVFMFLGTLTAVGGILLITQWHLLPDRANRVDGANSSPHE